MSISLEKVFLDTKQHGAVWCSGVEDTSNFGKHKDNLTAYISFTGLSKKFRTSHKTVLIIFLRDTSNRRRCTIKCVCFIHAMRELVTFRG